MEDLLAILIGLLYAAGVYQMLRRSIVKLILGLLFLSHATNLLLFYSGGLRGLAPLVTEAGSVMDPLPQAFILTAIVINFGIIAFFVILLFRAYQINRAEDLDELHRTE